MCTVGGGGAVGLANSWLSTLDGVGPTLGIIGLADSNDTDLNDQDFVTIPAPGAVLLGVIGLSIVGWIKRNHGRPMAGTDS